MADASSFARAAACHAGTTPEEDLDLSAGAAYRELVGIPSVECAAMLHVAPGAPAASYLAAKMHGAGDCFTGSRMPPTAVLSEQDLSTISSWIAQGAADN
jgi:hypothetical protein